jgi:branched-chain amino acid transport system permease protein
LGAGILTVLPEYLRAFRDFDILVYGVVLMVILLFMPEGIFSGLIDSARWIRKKW